MELIGAVVGTFTATIVLFLVGYILLYIHHRQHYPNTPSKTVYPLASSAELAKFPDYHVLESRPRGPLDAFGSCSCDVSKKNCRLMNKADWTDTRRGQGARTSSGVYSECPTYDLPSNHMASDSLPPLPPDPPPPSPPPSTTNQFALAGEMQVGYNQPHFLDPAIVAAVAAGNGANNQSTNPLAQTFAPSAILVDMFTLQRGQHHLQQQQQQLQQQNQQKTSIPTKEFHFLDHSLA